MQHSGELFWRGLAIGFLAGLSAYLCAREGGDHKEALWAAAAVGGTVCLFAWLAEIVASRLLARPDPEPFQAGAPPRVSGVLYSGDVLAICAPGSERSCMQRSPLAGIAAMGPPEKANLSKLRFMSKAHDPNFPMPLRYGERVLLAHQAFSAEKNATFYVRRAQTLITHYAEADDLCEFVIAPADPATPASGHVREGEPFRILCPAAAGLAEGAVVRGKDDRLEAGQAPGAVFVATVVAPCEPGDRQLAIGPGEALFH